MFQLGVLLQPSSSEALCHLGNGQLMQYDATGEASWLADAETSFRSSIEMEGKTVSATLVPDKLKEQGWWKKKHAQPAAPSPASSSTTPIKKSGTGPPPASSKQGTAQGHCSKGPASTTSRPAVGAAAKKVPPSKTPSATGAAKKQVAGTGGAARAPPKGGVAAQKSGVGARATSGTAGKPAGPDPKKQLPAPKTSAPSKQTGTSNSGAPKAATTVNTNSTAEKKDLSMPQIVNPSTHSACLGLARALIKTEDKKKLEEAEGLYEQVIKMSSELHDAYIELGDMLSKTAPAKAVEVYSKFPFSEPPTFDDAFLHGEIVRLVMKNEDYDNPRLSRSLIAMGKALGIGVIDKQVAILEGKFKSAVLKTVYAGIHGKPIDDPELQAFFKFRCWL